MSDFTKFLSTFKEQMQAELSRSDVLRALIYPLIVFAILFSFFVYIKSHWSIIIFSGILLSGFICVYIFSYLYCLMNDRDSLRSEKYSINKMAIEHGVYGDSNRGIIDVTPTESLKEITSNEVSEGDQ